MSGWAAENLPGFVTSTGPLGLAIWQWLILGAGLAFLGPGSRSVARIGLRGLASIAQRTRVAWDDDLVRLIAAPTRFLAAIGVAGLTVMLASLPPGGADLGRRVLQVALVVDLVWAGLAAIDFVTLLLGRRAMAGGEGDELRRRGIRTQVSVLRRVAHTVVLVLGGALVLTQFDVLRTIGLSLLASAGVAGVVLGFAAQKTIGSLLAGIQLSITQPIRIGDGVFLEGEYGTVEDVTLTYAVVKIWDDRRLIAPLTRFLEEPFQNWTKTSTALLGPVRIFADYRVPIDHLREVLREVVEPHPLWDRRVCVLQVLELDRTDVELRALVSARNAGALFDLRCAVRERMVETLRELDDGLFLPRQRYERARPNGAEADRSAP